MNKTPPANPQPLGRACAMLLEAAAVIAEYALPALDPLRRAGIDAVLRGGGVLAVEGSIDGVGMQRIALVSRSAIRS